MADAFEPLPRRRRPPKKPPAAKPTPAKDGWTVIVPVPKIAPPPPAQPYKHGTPSAIYTYRDSKGWELGYIYRLALKDGGKGFAPLTYCRNDGAGLPPSFEWRQKSWPSPRPLYGLDRLAKYPDRPVIVCEGEKAADAAAELLPGHVAVTSPNGAQGAAAADWKPLAGRRVVIWPDADEPGGKYAEAVRKRLAGSAASITILAPPEGVKPGWDAADALAEGWDQARAIALVSSPTAKIAADPAGDAGADEDEGEGEAGAKPRRERIVDILVGLATAAGGELWQNQYGEGYATIPIGDHYENWPILSARFKKWLINRHRRASDRSTPGSAVNDACANLDAIASEGSIFRPAVRVARRADAIYVDLGDDRWRAIKITALGRTIIDRPPVKFIRSPSMLALPEPEAGGSVDELRSFLPFKSDDDFMLYVAFLVGCFQGAEVAQPVLAIYGGEGTIKTTALKRARALVDPNEVEVERLPNGKDDIGPQLKDSWLVVYDNVSTISPTVSDLMSETSTGYGNSKKKLYTDEDTHRRFYKRPQAFSAINEAIVRGDLASRAIVVTAPTVEKYRREAEVDAEFEEARPRIFGALLDAVASALRHADEEPPETFRMADFVSFIWGARHGLGWTGHDFIRAYKENRETALTVVFEGDSFAALILTFVKELARIGRDIGLPEPPERGAPEERTMKDDVVAWTGTAKKLLDQLPTAEGDRKQRWWPSNENRVRGALRRAQTALANQGVAMDLDIRSHKHGRLIKLEADIKRLLGPPAELVETD